MAFSYLTRSQSLQFSDELDKQTQASIRKLAEDRSPQGSTFLSHSSNDSESVVGVIQVLQNHGASVYIDKKDSTLPPYTSKDTAAILKNRISQSRKFVLLASANSKDSRWVPWELGVADGYRRLENVAIFPVVEKSYDTAWVSWEYLGLYDRIVWGDLEGYKEKVWMVIDEVRNTASLLQTWLAR
jgi:hypothetical protein